MTGKRSKAEKLANSPIAPIVVDPVPTGAQVPLVYADAIGNLLMGPMTSRITLVLNVGPSKDGVQPTTPTMEVVIPTLALAVFGKQLQTLLKSRREDLAKVYAEVGKQLIQITTEEDK